MTEERFSELVLSNKDKMIALARSIVSNSEQAEDIVSDAFMKLWKRVRLFPPPNNLAGYLYNAVRNQCYDVMRRRKVENRIFVDSDPSELRQEKPTQSDPDAWDTRRLIQQALAKLNERERTIVTLKDINGFENDEIAEMLDMTEGNVRVILSRARKALREDLQKTMNIGL